MDDYNIRKVMNKTVELEKGFQYKKEIRVKEDCIKQSTLDIWCEKEVFHPEVIQYEIHKCFILKFELLFSMFFNSAVNLYHYTFKDMVLCNKIEKVTEKNIAEYFENGELVLRS